MTKHNKLYYDTERNGIKEIKYLKSNTEHQKTEILYRK